MDHHIIQHNLNNDTPIWRYMDMSKFALLVCQRKLWFSRADLLGDDHEGSLPDSIISGRELRWPNKDMRDRLERGSKEERKHIFISCWAGQDPESMAMWKIYTPNATGVAIQSTIGRLSTCFTRIPNDLFERFEAKIEKVDYNIDYDSHEVAEDEFNRFIHKLKAYSYEKEIRTLISSIPTVEEPRIGIGLNVDLEVLIDKIHVSHRLCDGLERFVEGILNENHIDKKVVHPPFVRTPKY